MRSIHRSSNIVSRSNKDTASIQCVDGREPHIHEVLSLGLDVIIRKVRPTLQVEVPAGTVREFVTNYLAKNGRRIHIIGKIFINNSV